ncbi:hypothetical protein [Actinomadura chibensis]|uniref:DUF3024 domain-containing protein n=1 Tax=Actinomadura chibensis TaxID=392828 RepID=A0A5D0NIP6_9ACTN|nr:hypothetical protein [Actinomadura chibensis]TYB44252.1 hypothetical protein FXF69_25240 [Actinomadura chibensis]
MFDDFGPAERLHAAVRRCAPQIAAAPVQDEEAGLTRVIVTYRDAGPWLIRWDGTSYTWHNGPHKDTRLGPDPETAAARVATTLGATP